MKDGLEQIIGQCISAGIKAGIESAFSCYEYPTEQEIFSAIDEEIWLEIYSQLEFNEHGDLPREVSK